MRVKDFTKKVGSGVTPKGGAEVYQDHGVPLFRSQNVTNEGFLLDDIAYISEDIDESMSGTRVKPNDVLLNITGASIGRCYYTPSDFERGNVNQHVCIIRPTKKIIAPYLYYNLISDIGQRQIDLTQTGSNREGLTKENICNFEFEVPPLDIQRRIVSYLDSHILSLDKRVSLLATKRNHYLRLRTAFINLAVTQGLNPDVKMKDSGIEWIGMIPEHWEIRRIKEIGKLRLGKMLTEKPKEGFVLKPYLKSKNVSWLNLILDSVEEMYFSEQELKELRLHYGDLVIAEGGEVGKTAIWRDELQDCYLQNSVHKLTCNKHFDSRYYSYFSYFLGQIEYYKSLVNLVSIMHLTYEKLRRVRVTVPPLSEQQAISTYLDEKCAKIDAIIENLNQQIDKHKLLKRALINEVITGQRAV